MTSTRPGCIDPIVAALRPVGSAASAVTSCTWSAVIRAWWIRSGS